MTGMLAACTKSVEDEFKPLFEVLDKQRVEIKRVTLIKDSFDVYKNGKKIDSFQFNLDSKSNDTLIGSFLQESEEGLIEEQVKYFNEKLQLEDNIIKEKLFFEEEHFSADYFKELKMIDTDDSFETYSKTIDYEEVIASAYTQKLIAKYDLSSVPQVKLFLEKHRANENGFSYVLHYFLFDEVTQVMVDRIFVFRGVSEDE